MHLNPERHAEISWRALQYFNLYRFLIATLFVMLIWVGRLPEPLGSHNPLLFTGSVHLYLLLTVSIMFCIHFHKPSYGTQINAHVLLDIVLISLLMYASNGIGSGFGMLLVVAIIGGSILRIGKIAILFAAVATLIVLAQEGYIDFFRHNSSPNYTHAGFLGLTFFITAFLGQILATRIQKSEALAEQRALDIENLNLLNERIVQRMRSGLMVLDDSYHIRLINQAAEHLLGLNNRTASQAIKHSAAELFQYIKDWDQNNGQRIITYRPADGDTDVQASFTRLNPASKFGILIFLEDIAQLRQQAQNLKITSLGHLSASIAHEVRNPLAAISHANQLLSESTTISQEDNHLIDIITAHTSRLNRIIENMQHISRRKAAVPEPINIGAWLSDFIADFMTQKKLQKTDIHVISASQIATIHMDSSQLHQVVWNLSENALRHSQLQHPRGTPLVAYQWGVRAGTDRAYLDVVDHGHGMSKESATQLFEPFFTTTSHGSGLGLYISRELCEANQASLILDKNTSAGCRFRIHFAHKEKYTGLLS